MTIGRGTRDRAVQIDHGKTIEVTLELLLLASFFNMDQVIFRAVLISLSVHDSVLELIGFAGA